MNQWEALRGRSKEGLLTPLRRHYRQKCDKLGVTLYNRTAYIRRKNGHMIEYE